MDEVIDLDTSPSLDLTQWIRQQKTYDTRTLPFQVIEACTAATRLPDDHHVLIPSPDLSVHDYLSVNLPVLLASIVTLKPGCWFITDTPDKEFSYLFSRPFPPPSAIQRLRAAFGQAWIDGAKSIIDPRFNDGRDWLPLWTLSYWQVISNTVQACSLWNGCKDWLTKESRTVEATQLMDQARGLLRLLSWDMDIGQGYGITTHEFVRLLGMDWITDTLEDMMVAHLAHRASRACKNVLIGTSILAEFIKSGALVADFSPSNAPLLHQYERQIKARGVERLYLPVHVNGNHWIAVAVDFVGHTIAYGEHS